MAITKLTIENFKSFARVEVDFSRFNVIVGPNAAGKSNLTEAIAFLRDITEHGLEDAVAIHGGIKALLNFDADGDRLLRVSVEYDDRESADKRVLVNELDQRILENREGQIVGVKKRHSTYGFAIRPHKKGAGFSVVHDEMSRGIALVKLEPAESENKDGSTHWFSISPQIRSGQYREVETLSEGALILNQRSGRLQARLDPSLDKNVATSDLSPFLSHTPQRHFTRFLTQTTRMLMLESPLLRVTDMDFVQALESTRIYDFDLKKPKQAVPVSGVKELDGDGGNLAIVLQEILRRRENRRRFINLVSDLLPFVDSVGVDTLAYNSLLAKLTERRSSGKRDLSVAWASDGTISVLAMVAALFFAKGELALFEEPDRNMHPHLIGRLVQMMKEASENKQIILTTHNPEILRHSDLDDILLVQRDDAGNSTISRPADSETLKIFLENELGVEDLFVQNLLGI